MSGPEINSLAFIGGTSEGTKGLSSQLMSPFWFENQTYDHANVKQ
jgi:hypothetical protein